MIPCDTLDLSHAELLCTLQTILPVSIPVWILIFLYSESKPPVHAHITTRVRAGMSLVSPTLIVMFLFSDITQVPGLDFISTS